MRWIETGLQEGAKLVLDGRDITVPGFENGFYLGPTILDHVTEGMTVGSCEIFGPVLCIKCVKDFEEGLAVMNGNRFANGSVIFTSSGYYSREFAWRTDGGMVGINVGIPVPVGREAALHRDCVDHRAECQRVVRGGHRVGIAEARKREEGRADLRHFHLF